MTVCCRPQEYLQRRAGTTRVGQMFTALAQSRKRAMLR